MTEIEKGKSIYTPEIKIFSAEAVDHFVADAIVKQINNQPESVFIMPTGATPLGMYANLVEAYQQGLVNFQGVTFFNLDEYWPIQHNHQGSYTRYMEENFYRKTNFPPENKFIPEGEATDPDTEALHYGTILRCFLADMAILGIGPGKTCHIGFNEIGSLRESRTRYVPLSEDTKVVNSRFFLNPTEIPAGTITLGIADILEAKKIILIAKGETKAWGIWRMLKGEIGQDAPASYLRLHPQVTVILDQEAGSLIK